MEDTTFEQPAGSARCPVCGSPLDSRATICAACGTPLATPAPAVSDASAPQSAPDSLPTLAQPAGATAFPDEPAQRMPLVAPVASVTPGSPGTPAHTKRCDWCGMQNGADAERCASCGAVFPRPEQDDAIRRAGEARIRAAEEEIELRRRVRKWYSLGRRDSDRK